MVLKAVRARRFTLTRPSSPAQQHTHTGGAVMLLSTVDVVQH